MAKRTILSYPDKRLHTVAKPVQGVDARIKTLVADMLETMYDAERHRPGRHAGRRARAAGRDRHLRGAQPAAGADQSRDRLGQRREGAQRRRLPLGARHLRRRRALDRRPRARARRRTASAQTIEAEGLLAVCIQHELDHLLGKVFVEYLSPLKRNRIKSKLLKQQREDQKRDSGKDGADALCPRLARRAAAGGAVLAGCASEPTRHRAGHLRAPRRCSGSARRPPSYPLRGGGERLQYSRAPAGFEVNNVDLDAGGPAWSRSARNSTTRLFDRTIQPGVVARGRRAAHLRPAVEIDARELVRRRGLDLALQDDEHAAPALYLPRPAGRGASATTPATT